ncbi:MAG: hypothetical protein KKH88_04075 [Nanoarchaeota archaeon]|nr:hypothetical protein [Nanoarchaeota archaeon]
MQDLASLDRPELEKIIRDQERTIAWLRRNEGHILDVLKTFTRRRGERKKALIADVLTQSNLLFGLNFSAYLEYDCLSNSFVGRYGLGSTTPEEWKEDMYGLFQDGDLETMREHALEHLVPINLTIPLEEPSVFRTLRDEKRTYRGQEIPYTEVDQMVVDTFGGPFVAITFKGASERVIGVVYGNKNITGESVELSSEDLELYSRIRYPAATVLEVINADLLREQNELFINAGLSAAELAHETKNAITALGGFVRQLPKFLKDGDEAGLMEAMGIIQEEQKRLEKIYNTTISHEDRVRPKPEKFEVVSILEKVAEGLAINYLQIPGKDFPKPEYTITSEHPEVLVYADPEQIEKRILHPVIQNAFEAMLFSDASEGKIEGRPDVLEIKVRTSSEVTVIGITNPQIMKPSILRRLQEGQLPGTSKKYGIGQGFAIAGRFAYQNGCNFRVGSNETDGTTVSLSIPYNP